ncbi:MAG: tetratricopeptide repeat protein [Gammaproteobacteria bacterium]|nr:tetratricopeptide repeat protein [Gammaproteobacteria bacterium]
MSEIYESDQEQVEKLKKWWDENGKTTVFGLVLGLGGMFGWAAWQAHRTAQAEAASTLYSQIVQAAEDDDYAKVDATAQTLIAGFADSGYATLATFYRAKAALEEGNSDGAAVQLEWISNNSTQLEYRDIARLRLARLALDAGDAARAEAIASATPSDSVYAGAFQALRGNIAERKGDIETARKAYQSALDALDANTAQGLRLRLALDNLGTLNVEHSPDA